MKVIIVHLTHAMHARRHIYDPRVLAVILFRSDDQLRHQQMSQKKMSQVVDCHLRLEAILGLLVRRRHHTG